VNRLARIVRLASLRETRRAITGAARSPELRALARRTRTDRRGLLRDLRDPANARAFVRAVVRHPAARELASAGMLVLPGRYLPLGWVAAWAANRVLRRMAPAPAVPGEPGRT
jgi:hypothetical protein